MTTYNPFSLLAVVPLFPRRESAVLGMTVPAESSDGGVRDEGVTDRQRVIYSAEGFTAWSADRSSQGAGLPIPLGRRRLLRCLVVTIAVLAPINILLRLPTRDPDVVAALAANEDTGPFEGYPRLVRLFDLDGEANLSTWLSTTILLLAALVLAALSQQSRASGDRWFKHWALLGVVFTYLSVDEVAQLHEQAIPVVDVLIEPRGMLTFGWVLIAAPIVAAFGLAYLRFLASLPSSTRRLVFVSALLYVGGGLGLEMVGAWIYDTYDGPASIAYILASTVEEVLELLGAALFLYTVMALHDRRVADEEEVRSRGPTTCG